MPFAIPDSTGRHLNVQNDCNDALHDCHCPEQEQCDRQQSGTSPTSHPLCAGANVGPGSTSHRGKQDRSPCEGDGGRVNCMDCRMSSTCIAQIMTEGHNFLGLSRRLVDLNCEHPLGFRFLPIMSSFLLTDVYITSGIQFAPYHPQQKTNWPESGLSNESCFFMDSSRIWVWWRPVETVMACTICSKTTPQR